MSVSNWKGITYIVHSGDTLSTICRRYNVSNAAVCRENPFLDIYDLKVGDEIYIPVETNIPRKCIIAYTVKKNDTIQDILCRYQIELDDLLKYNELDHMKLIPDSILYVPIKDYH